MSVVLNTTRFLQQLKQKLPDVLECLIGHVTTATFHSYTCTIRVQ